MERPAETDSTRISLPFSRSGARINFGYGVIRSLIKRLIVSASACASDEALQQYAELKEQAVGMDAAELMDARLAVREEKERSAIDKAKAAYGEKYDPMMMYDSKRDVANLLHEEAEVRSGLCGISCAGNSNNRYSKSRTRRKVETVGSDKISAGVHFERCAPAFLR